MDHLKSARSLSNPTAPARATLPTFGAAAGCLPAAGPAA